jgi:hypothetical protein
MQRLGRPEPLRQDFGEPASFYRSPLLAQLERARDLENGVPARVGFARRNALMGFRRQRLLAGAALLLFVVTVASGIVWVRHSAATEPNALRAAGRLSNTPASRQQDVVGLVSFLTGEEFLVRAVLKPEAGEMGITERVDVLDAAMHEH